MPMPTHLINATAMIFRRLLKYRGLGINLLAGCCFIVLANYGWGLGWNELGSYLLLLLVSLVCLIGIAACLGWLLRKYIAKNKRRK